MRKRMDAAKLLLQTPGISITEVCQQVGYFDLSSFGKLFRRYYNLSPTDLSRRFRQNKRSEGDPAPTQMGGSSLKLNFPDLCL
jgi:AraC-like DNA-binding protein